MSLHFESLEPRKLFARLVLDVDGPIVASVGAEATYAVTITNPNAGTVSATVQFWLPLEELAWSLDGENIRNEATSPSPEFTVELAPQESKFLGAAGRVPEDVDSYFQFYGEIDSLFGGGLIWHTTVVIDEFVNSDTVQVIVNETAGIAHELTDSSGFQSAIPAGDVNEDGIDDVYLNYVNQHTYVVNDDYRYDFQRRRQTLFGSPDHFPPRLLASNDEILETWEGLAEIPIPKDTPPRFRRAPFGTTERLSIGDIDGDGFEDFVSGGPRDIRNEGTATILFGPDHRDNVVIIGGSDAGQPGTETFFGSHAGPLGDLNGDGTNDYYILGSAYGWDTLYVFYGRNFDRDIAGDVDRDGVVDMDDFSILATNFGRANRTREDGDLDGDSRVTFEDFVILSHTFGRTKTP